MPISKTKRENLGEILGAEAPIGEIGTIVLIMRKAIRAVITMTTIDTIQEPTLKKGTAIIILTQRV